MNYVGNIASILTITTFAIFIVGKILFIRSRKKEIINEFTFDYLENCQDIYDEITISSENNYNGPVYISSAIALKRIRFCKKSNNSVDSIKKQEIVYEYYNLPANRALAVNVKIPEGGSEYYVNAIRDDYVRIEKELAYNGSGLKKNDMPIGIFTLKSYLFYLFKQLCLLKIY